MLKGELYENINLLNVFIKNIDIYVSKFFIYQIDNVKFRIISGKYLIACHRSITGLIAKLHLDLQTIHLYS